jgi:hypothetical protein
VSLFACLKYPLHKINAFIYRGSLLVFTDYDSYVSFFSSRHRPIGVNGEGLTIRSDIESELGWDFGPVAAENLVMGQRIFAAGHSFCYIPGYVMIAPATPAKFSGKR